MSSITHLLIPIGALALALGTLAWRISRAVLLQRAGSAAIKHGCKDPRGKAGLKVVDALTGESEPWYRAILPWRKPDDGSGP
jgi:hypothetical protein